MNGDGDEVRKMNEACASTANPADAPPTDAPSDLTVTFQARFRTAQRPRKAPAAPAGANEPNPRRGRPAHTDTKLAEHLALAHYVERCIADGALLDYADAARRLGVTRARICQIMNLTLLPVRVQEDVLLGRMTSETEVRKLLSSAST